MIEEITPLTGGCLCGAVRFRVTAEPLVAYYCHCTICQRTTGGPFTTGATVPIEGFAFTKGEPRAYESSPEFVRLSCSVCGSPLGVYAKENRKLVHFRLGCLDDPNTIRPQFHAYTSTQVGWCEITDGLPRYLELSPETEKIWAELDG